jgi:hypothetical protein
MNGKLWARKPCCELRGEGPQRQSELSRQKTPDQIRGFSRDYKILDELAVLLVLAALLTWFVCLVLLIATALAATLLATAALLLATLVLLTILILVQRHNPLLVGSVGQKYRHICNLPYRQISFF